VLKEAAANAFSQKALPMVGGIDLNFARLQEGD